MKNKHSGKCSKCSDSLINKYYRQSFTEDKLNRIKNTLTCFECIEKEKASKNMFDRYRGPNELSRV